MTPTTYGPGFASLHSEVDDVALPVTGTIPEWLSGTLIRNGPGVFDTPRRSFRHWFDGLAMLHRFDVDAGAVRYGNRLLDTEAARSVRERGRIGYAEFATDPCSSIFSRFFTRFRRRSTPNASVNVTRFGDRYVALTETPLPVEFDPSTLDTVGVYRYQDDLGGNTTTAHPHVEPATGDLVNFTLAFGRSSEYRIYRQRGDAPRELIASVPSRRPGYVHSFAITERYAVLVVFPLVVDPLSFVLRGRPFIENFRWRPELGTRIVVVDTADGRVRADATAEPCFAFHHINAYERDGAVVVDLCAYADANVIDALYLDRLRDGGPTPAAWPTRLTVPLNGGGVDVRRLADEPVELPRIAYGSHNGRPYRFVYGTGTAKAGGTDFFDRLVKVDIDTGRSHTWQEPGCHPGEPVFVPAPAGPTPRAEDEGVVLSVVLDTAAGRSFLLVLDAATFTEVARASAPHAIPFGFHGVFERST
jgi:carotenoid cleavage dioxygenase-like enzyme